jgi:hypothetical protein
VRTPSWTPLVCTDRELEAHRQIAQPAREVCKTLKELRALALSLKTFVDKCSDRCAGGPTGSCVILKDLCSPQTGCCG